MANLPEVAQWGAEEDSIYQLELMDFITGGAGGNDNEPHRLLANRTRYLKKQQDVLIDDMSKVGGIKNLLVNGDLSVNNLREGGAHTAIQPLTYVCDKWVVNIGDNLHAEPTCDCTVSNGEIRIFNNSHPTVYEMKVRQAIRFNNGFSPLELGKKYTVSLYAKADVGVNITVSIFYAGHLSWDGDTSVGGGVMGVGTGSYERYEFTFTNSTVPNNGENALIVAFLAKGNEVKFKNIQLEKNDKATDFEYVPRAITEQLCLYDYEIGSFSFQAVSGSLQSIYISFKAKSVTPLVSIFALNGVENTVSSIGDSAGHIGSVGSILLHKNSAFRVSVSGLTANSAYMANYVADSRYW